MGPERKLPSCRCFIFLQNLLRKRQNRGVFLGGRTDEFQSFGSAFLPVIRGCFRQMSARKVEFENLAIIFSLASHFLRAGLAEADSMAGTAAGKQNMVAIIAEVIEVAADFVPTQRAIYGKPEGRSRYQNVGGSIAFQPHMLRAAALRAGNDFH